MATQDFEHIIQAYIKQVLKIQREKNQKAVSQTDLQEIATQLGLTDKDWQYIEDEFKAFWVRGQQYSKYKQWDYAIQELEQAVLLQPINKDAIFDLASAYKNKWLLNQHHKAKKNAEMYAQRCLQLDYEYEKAVQLITELNLKSNKLRGAKWLRLSIFVLSGLALSLVLWIFLQDLVFKKSKTVRPAIPQQVEKNVVEKNIRRISVELEKTTQLQNFRLDVETSLLENNHYIFKGSINHKNKIIQHLDLEAIFLNENAQVIWQEKINLLDEDKTEVLPTESQPLVFNAQREGIYTTAKIILRIAKEKTIAPEADESSEEDMKVLTDSLMANKFLGLIIRERNQKIEPLVQSFDHEITLQFENQGANPIKKIEIEVAWFDNEDKLIDNKNITLLTEEEPMLKPKQKRAKALQFQIKSPKKYYKKYYVSLLKME